MTKEYVDQAEQDMRDGMFSYEGVIGLVDNFECYVVTDHISGPDIKEIYRWCEKTFGPHKGKWLFIPEVIEKGHTHWFLSNEKLRTLFNLKWQTVGGS